LSPNILCRTVIPYIAKYFIDNFHDDYLGEYINQSTLAILPTD
jgi:hypothetical protein